MPSTQDRQRTTGLPHLLTVWSCAVADALSLPGAQDWLDQEERLRAHEMRRLTDRNRFVATRILLRNALTNFVGGDIGFGEWNYGHDGKGKLRMEPGLPQIEFNVSHADECVVVGVSERYPVGVDVECLATKPHLEIVEDVLTERELRFLYSHTKDQRWDLFVKLWTLKEACAKAAGLGIELEFRELEITLDPTRVDHSVNLPQVGKTCVAATRQSWCSGNPYCLAVAAVVDRANIC
jgi:4'-phosphopantetheinyl transferase